MWFASLSNMTWLEYELLCMLLEKTNEEEFFPCTAQCNSFHMRWGVHAQLMRRSHMWGGSTPICKWRKRNDFIHQNDVIYQSCWWWVSTMWILFVHNVFCLVSLGPCTSYLHNFTSQIIWCFFLDTLDLDPRNIQLQQLKIIVYNPKKIHKSH